MISQGKNFMPGAIKKELRAAGMNHLFSGQKITKQQALHAVSHLKDKGLLKTSRRVAQIYEPAAQEQYRQDLAKSLAKKQKHIRAGFKGDIAEEAIAEERGESSPYYDPRSVIGSGRISDQIRKEKDQKDKQSNQASGRINGSNRFNGTQTPKTKVPDLTNLPDMGIDFGK